MRKNISFLFVVSCLFSCDYFADYTYKVVNESSEAITIHAQSDQGGFRIQDSLTVLQEGEFLKISEDLGTSGKHHIPEDNYTSTDTIPPISRFLIVINDHEYDTLRFRHFWDYEGTERNGIYTLTITDELLEKIR
ncbi:hypothetical protein [Fulvivirga ligni]|uniref:hypothetical protein n=1 Tax=Fulvivirga ligni TaxID=2904246 RepID=UPI001F42BD70|nr:hypothetical protein [Fulvivirga ligni]UII22269.1 hypothetical protein LVD16_03365 [Fulvivirga ligni]